MQLIPYLFVFLIGINIGSFLNVCIYRIPLGKTIVKGRSYCPKCDKLIPWYYNIPVISYLFLRGKCGYCKSPISLIYPAVELLNGILYSAAFFVYGFNITAILTALLISLLIVTSFIDSKYQIIPDGLVLSILVLGLVNSIYQVMFTQIPWQTFVIGFFAASVPLFLLGLVYEGGLGGGDIKLMAVCGLFTGWKLILLSLLLGDVIAFLYVAVLFMKKKAKKGTAIPFGPFLSAGIIGSMLIGDQILNWYIRVFF